MISIDVIQRYIDIHMYGILCNNTSHHVTPHQVKTQGSHKEWSRRGHSLGKSPEVRINLVCSRAQLIAWESSL